MQNWTKRKKPVIGSAPMDGVSDASYRFITDKYGHPDVIFTEFVSVEGLIFGNPKILRAYVKHETETPTVAQLFGADPKNFYDAAFIPLELGYDGIDINMGCPDDHVASRGAGAGLIKTPKIAKEIIKNVGKALTDWQNGKKIEETKVNEEIIKKIKRMQNDKIIERKNIPVTLKTRIGYDFSVIEDWVKHLLEASPDAITIHGRTLKQRYTGLPDWEAIAKAVELAKNTGTKILGNGNVLSIQEAKDKINTYDLYGVLIGRGAYGNPWVFADRTPSMSQKIKVMLEHCEAFSRFYPSGHFPSLRKHLAWYMKGIEGSAKTRYLLMSAESTKDVKKVLSSSKRYLGNL